MKRRRAEFVIGYFALLLTFAAPASAQLTVKNANPVSGTAGAMLFDSNPQLWTLPTVVRFMDDSTFGVCRPENYRITITWDAASGSLVDEAKIYRTLQPSPVEPRCEYSAHAPGPPVPAAQQPPGGRDYAYTESRDYNYAIQVCRISPPECAPAVTNTAHIGDAPYTGMVVPNLLTTSTRSFTGVVALISDKNWYAKPDAFRASINWGDKTGSIPADRIVAVNGAFAVTGSHTYESNAIPGSARARQSSENQSFTVTVTVGPTTAATTRSGRPRAATEQIFQGPITVAPPPDCVDTTVRCLPMKLAVVGTRRLDLIATQGLKLTLGDVPYELQYGVILKLIGPDRKSVASTVLPLRPHSGPASATVPRTWRLKLASLCRIKPGQLYALVVPQRPGYGGTPKSGVLFRGPKPTKCGRTAG